MAHFTSRVWAEPNRAESSWLYYLTAPSWCLPNPKSFLFYFLWMGWNDGMEWPHDQDENCTYKNDCTFEALKPSAEMVWVEWYSDNWLIHTLHFSSPCPWYGMYPGGLHTKRAVLLRANPLSTKATTFAIWFLSTAMFQQICVAQPSQEVYFTRTQGSMLLSLTLTRKWNSVLLRLIFLSFPPFFFTFVFFLWCHARVRFSNPTLKLGT